MFQAVRQAMYLFRWRLMLILAVQVILLYLGPQLLCQLVITRNKQQSLSAQWPYRHRRLQVPHLDILLKPQSAEVLLTSISISQQDITLPADIIRLVQHRTEQRQHRHLSAEHLRLLVPERILLHLRKRFQLHRTLVQLVISVLAPLATLL